MCHNVHPKIKIQLHYWKVTEHILCFLESDGKIDRNHTVTGPESEIRLGASEGW